MNVLIERKLDIPVYEFRYSDVLDKAHEMIQSGTKIIISRGGTAALLRSNITIPVVEIAHDFHGVYRRGYHYYSAWHHRFGRQSCEVQRNRAGICGESR